MGTDGRKDRGGTGKGCFRLFLFSLPFVIIVGYHLIGPYDYFCRNCGAYRVYFYGRPGGGHSEWLEKITGKPCRHSWAVNSYCVGLVDLFAHRDIPLRSDAVRDAIDALPKQEWKRDLVDAMTAEGNLLKWAAVMALEEARRREKREDLDWESWRADFSDCFSPEYDLENARSKSEAMLRRMEQEGGIPAMDHQRSYMNLLRDLGATDLDV